MVKIISGVYSPTEGTIIYEGVKRNFKNPRQALDSGILVIHQELNVANELTVAENIYLGVEPRLGNKKSFILNRKKMNKDAQAVLDLMGVNIKATDILGNLSTAQQQMVEIARVITKKAKLVIMDEPTSSLSESEINALFKQIKILKENNVSIIYITHRLKELQEICDRVTILRDGQVVKHLNIRIRLNRRCHNMVGREITDYYNKTEHKRKRKCLELKG